MSLGLTEAQTRLISSTTSHLNLAGIKHKLPLAQLLTLNHLLADTSQEN